jgi:hypothetical protein
MTTTASASASEAGQLAPPVQELEVKALAAWEGLKHQIEEAKKESKDKTFNYNNVEDLKAARSWLYRLRGLNGQIEGARKDAKEFYLEGGRTVDSTAKGLKRSVAALIQPHKDAIEEIEAREAKRVADHRSVLAYIESVTAGVTTSAEALARLEALQEVDTTTLEEFATAAANRQAEALEQLQALRDTLQRQEAERAELEALRREKEDREAADRAEQLRLEGEQRERDRAEQQRQRDADDAQKREARALADAEDAKRRANEAEERERQAAAARAAELERQQEAEQAAAEARATRQAELIESLIAAMRGKKAAEVAAAMVAGSFHPAVVIDWSSF